MKHVKQITLNQMMIIIIAYSVRIIITLPRKIMVIAIQKKMKKQQLGIFIQIKQSLANVMKNVKLVQDLLKMNASHVLNNHI